MVIATPPLELLLIEDSPSDVRLTVEVLREVSPEIQLTTASDGTAALNLLAGRRTQKQALPDLILLDLNLPLMHGHEVLERIKTTVGMRHIPIVVLTTSRAEQDALRCYELGANALINKPVDLNGFVKTMKAFTAFWIDHAKLWRARGCD